MATKDYNLHYHDKYGNETFDNQYKNLNLNQSHKYFSENAVNLNSTKKTDNKKNSNYDFNDAKKDSKLWNYDDNKKLNLSNYNVSDKEKSKEEKKSNVNNSTLSLHIAAYENLNDEASTEFCDDKDYKLKSKKLDLVKKWKTAKASIIENRFEFPRQQENNNNKPGFMEFKSSQKLHNRSIFEKGMSDSIRYAAEYIAYFFYCDPFISGEEIERFTLELANSIINTINQNECCRKKLVQRTQPNSQRECCQRSDEFVMEINVDGRLASMIGDIAQSVMTLTPQEIADLLPDNTYVVISETYAFYSTNHGPCLFIFKSQSCKLIGISHRLKRNPIIRYSYDSHCFEINRKWLNKNSGYPKTNSSELIPRIQVVGSLETRHKNARKKNGHHSVMTPPKSAPPFLSRSSSFDIDENQEIGQKFLQMVKARLI